MTSLILDLADSTDQKHLEVFDEAGNTPVQGSLVDPSVNRHFERSRTSGILPVEHVRTTIEE
jgi:hypothetical protein